MRRELNEMEREVLRFVLANSTPHNGVMYRDASTHFELVGKGEAFESAWLFLREDKTIMRDDAWLYGTEWTSEDIAHGWRNA